MLDKWAFSFYGTIFFSDFPAVCVLNKMSLVCVDSGLQQNESLLFIDINQSHHSHLKLVTLTEHESPCGFSFNIYIPENEYNFLRPV